MCFNNYFPQIWLWNLFCYMVVKHRALARRRNRNSPAATLKCQGRQWTSVDSDIPQMTNLQKPNQALKQDLVYQAELDRSLCQTPGRRYFQLLLWVLDRGSRVRGYMTGARRNAYLHARQREVDDHFSSSWNELEISKQAWSILSPEPLLFVLVNFFPVEYCWYGKFIPPCIKCLHLVLQTV